MKNNRFIKICVSVMAVIVTVCTPLNAAALGEGILSPADYPLQDIRLYSSLAQACEAAAASPDGSDNEGKTLDYAGRPILTADQLAKIAENQKVYEAAAAATKVPWQFLAVIHLREFGLKRENPANGQGIYQNYNKAGGPYPPGPVSEEEFRRQTIFTGNRIRTEFAGDKANQLATGDPAAVKHTFFGYNGRAAAYVKQAKDLGLGEGYEGSPYVMNIADKIRDPEFNKTTWGQIKSDGGGMQYPANNDYGAFVVFAALAGIPSSSGTCVGAGGAVDPRVGANGWEVTGTNAMVTYFQNQPPWATQRYGGGTIEECGCGPTSMAMVVATLKKDKSVTPKTMADYFASNGGQTEGCPSTWALFNSSSVLAKKYGLQITNLGTDMSKVAPALKAGSFVLMSQKKGIFTSGGHLMLMRGVTAGGNYLVADPISEAKTNNANGYTKAQITASLRNMWEIRLTGGA